MPRQPKCNDRIVSTPITWASSNSYLAKSVTTIIDITSLAVVIAAATIGCYSSFEMQSFACGNLVQIQQLARPRSQPGRLAPRRIRASQSNLESSHFTFLDKKKKKKKKRKKSEKKKRKKR